MTLSLAMGCYAGPIIMDRQTRMGSIDVFQYVKVPSTFHPGGICLVSSLRPVWAVANKSLVSVAVPPVPVRIPSERPLAPSVSSVTSVANDKGDNQMILGVVHRSPGICFTAEENWSLRFSGS